MPYSLLWSFVGSRGASLVGMLEGEMARTPVETALSLLGREGGREGGREMKEGGGKDGRLREM